MDVLPDFINDDYAQYDSLTSPGLPDNGRVSFLERSSAGGPAPPVGQGYNGFMFTAQTQQPGVTDEMLRGNFEETPLSNAYFSPENISIIQNAVRRSVYERSGNKWIIDPQSPEEVKIVMRSIYYLHARHLSTHIREQIIDLNKRVVEWIVPRIYSEIKQYQYYINDISKMPEPLSHPTYMSEAGARTPKNPVFFDAVPYIPPPTDRIAFE